MPFVESLPSVIGAAAVLPALLMLWLVASIDHRPEPPKIVGAAFVLGIAALFATRLLREPLEPLLHLASQPWPSVVARAFLVAAIPEECSKVAVVALLVMCLRQVADPMDGVVYGAAVGLGFAAWENLGYLLRDPADWQALVIMRTVLTVPFHASLGMIAGAYLTRARFAGALGASSHTPFHKGTLRILALAIPIAFHGAFDTCVLAVRHGLAHTPAGMLMLELGSMTIGFGAIALGSALALELAQRQWVGRNIRNPSAGRRRAAWVALVIGGTACFAGAAVSGAAAHRAWIAHGTLDTLGILAGLALLLSGLVVSYTGRSGFAPPHLSTIEE